MSTDPINEINDEGTGRPFVILFEDPAYRGLAEQMFQEITRSQRAILLQSTVIRDDNWSELTEVLKAYLVSKKIRQASFICFAATSSIVLNLTLHDLKQVRSLILVDACTRPHPTWGQAMIDRVERFLPLGLPLRSKDSGFDAKSFLQRLRCPILIVTTQRAGQYINGEAEIFKYGLPTAWAVVLGPQNEARELTEAVLEFQKVPAKCPQKSAPS